ncbi:MAG: hypothetical protein ACREQ5_27720, partial [Candidatus Dormibacteria bacterium]
MLAFVGRLVRRLSLAAALAASSGLAAAQTITPEQALRGPQASTTFASSFGPSLRVSDAQALQEILAAEKEGQGDRIQALVPYLTDPTARAMGLWALVETAPASLTFAQADEA